MSAQLNHTIVWCRNKQISASFLVEILGLPAPEPFGPMLIVKLENGVSLDYYDNDPPIASQHYAFLVSDDDFDAAFARLQARQQAWWADPCKQQPQQINDYGGGRRVYFDDPDGHLLEIFTRERMRPAADISNTNNAAGHLKDLLAPQRTLAALSAVSQVTRMAQWSSRQPARLLIHTTVTGWPKGLKDWLWP